MLDTARVQPTKVRDDKFSPDEFRSIPAFEDAENKRQNVFSLPFGSRIEISYSVHAINVDSFEVPFHTIDPSLHVFRFI